MRENFECKIIRKLAVLSDCQKGWQLELNEISWRSDPPKLDLRRWKTDRTRCSKGITLTQKEAENLLAALREELEE